jgi:hypothetical protein
LAMRLREVLTDVSDALRRTHSFVTDTTVSRGEAVPLPKAGKMGVQCSR